MQEISVNKFRANLENSIDSVVANHIPLKVRQKNGKDFIIVSLEDWEREQETLYILRNKNLMNQINESFEIHKL